MLAEWKEERFHYTGLSQRTRYNNPHTDAQTREPLSTVCADWQYIWGMFSTFATLRSRCTCIPDPTNQQIYPIGSEDACSKTGEWLQSGWITEQLWVGVWERSFSLQRCTTFCNSSCSPLACLSGLFIYIKALQISPNVPKAAVPEMKASQSP